MSTLTIRASRLALALALSVAPIAALAQQLPYADVSGDERRLGGLDFRGQRGELVIGIKKGSAIGARKGRFSIGDGN